MASRTRVLAAIVLASLVTVGIGMGESTASATPQPNTPGAGSAHSPLTVKHIPSASTGPVRMFAYPASHFTAASRKLPASLAIALKRDLGESTATYLADADADARAVLVVDALHKGGVDVLGSSMSGTALSVNVRTTADASAVRAAGAKPVLGAPKAFTSNIPVSPDSSPVVYPGEAYETYWPTLNLISSCSMGFTGYEVSSATSAPALEQMTAGHCLFDDSHTTVASDVAALPEGPPGVISQSRYDNAGPLFSNVVSAIFGSGYDAGLMAARSGTTETPELATWGYDSPATTEYPNVSAPIAITGETQAIVGAPLCKSGYRTGWTCGKVLAVNKTYDVNGHDNKPYAVNAIIASTCIEPGDSGGAAIIGSLAAGIDSFSTDSIGCGNKGYYAGYFPLVASSSHPSIEKIYPEWELQASVAPPALTHPTTSGTILRSTDSLTGTFVGGSGGQYVALFFDGATSNSDFAKTKSSAWSYPLSGLTPGSHTVKIESRFGHYSASTDVTTSFTVYPGATIKKPTISGTAKVGSTLTAKSTMTPTTGTIHYQWQSAGRNVGADQATYVPGAGDLGSKITVIVTGSATDYVTTEPSSSKSTKAVAHGTLAAQKPVVSGYRNVGQTLTTTVASWGPGTVSLTYQWLRNGKKIAAPLGTASSYTQVTADRGAKFDVIVTGTEDGFTTKSVTSTKTKTATGYPLFASTVVPTIDDTTPTVLQTLTATPGTWSPAATFSYQWLENGKKISKATKVTYTVPLAYAGKTITVAVTGRATATATTTLTSASTSAVASIQFTSIGTGSFSG